MHNTGIRLQNYLDTLNQILSVERKHYVNELFKEEQHNGLTLFNNTIEVNFDLAAALRVRNQAEFNGKTNNTDDTIRSYLCKAFRGLAFCYIVVFSGESIDMEVIESRLKWSEALEIERPEEPTMIAYFAEAQESVVKLLQELASGTFNRSSLVSAMICLSHLLRDQGYVLSELFAEDKEYLYKMFPQTFIGN